MDKVIRVVSTKYDGSPRDEWPAHLIERRGNQLRLYVPAGAEEIVKGSKRQLIEIPFYAMYWTDRWYNIWQFDRTHGIVFYANVAMPCQFDGGTIRWTDLDMDVLVYADGSVMVKDEHEFEERRADYPTAVVRSALASCDELVRLANAGEFPFQRADF